MNKVINLRNTLFLIPISILLFSFFLAKSKIASLNPTLFIGITYDMVILIPLTYFFAIRKTKIPRLTVISVFVLSYWAARFFLPDTGQSHLSIIGTYFFPILELFIMGFVIYNSYHIIKSFNHTADKDILSAFGKATQNTLGDNLISKLLAVEIATIYYAFFDWKTKKLTHNEFSYHIENGALGIWGALIFLIFIETFAIHLLLAQWNVVVAWVLFGISLYTAIQFFAHTKAMLKRPISIHNDTLVLRYGIFGNTKIPLSMIDKIEETSNFENQNYSKPVSISILEGVESYNLAIILKEEVEIEKIYTLKKKSDVILLHVDEKERFLANFAS